MCIKLSTFLFSFIPLLFHLIWGAQLILHTIESRTCACARARARACVCTNALASRLVLLALSCTCLTPEMCFHRPLSHPHWSSISPTTTLSHVLRNSIIEFDLGFNWTIVDPRALPGKSLLTRICKPFQEAHFIYHSHQQICAFLHSSHKKLLHSK